MKILFDKTKNRISTDDYWIDQDGELWVNSNPFGANMNGSETIMLIPKNHYKYELRDNVCQHDLYALNQLYSQCRKCNKIFKD